MTTSSQNTSATPRINITTVAICVLLAIAPVLLWRDHRAHVFSVLPYLLLAACPIMHLLMHRRHGTHTDDSPKHHT